MPRTIPKTMSIHQNTPIGKLPRLNQPYWQKSKKKQGTFAPQPNSTPERDAIITNTKQTKGVEMDQNRSLFLWRQHCTFTSQSQTAKIGTTPWQRMLSKSVISSGQSFIWMGASINQNTMKVNVIATVTAYLTTFSQRGMRIWLPKWETTSNTPKARQTSPTAMLLWVVQYKKVLRAINSPRAASKTPQRANTKVANRKIVEIVCLESFNLFTPEIFGYFFLLNIASISAWPQVYFLPQK